MCPTSQTATVNNVNKLLSNLVQNTLLDLKQYIRHDSEVEFQELLQW